MSEFAILLKNSKFCDFLKLKYKKSIIVDNRLQFSKQDDIISEIKHYSRNYKKAILDASTKNVKVLIHHYNPKTQVEIILEFPDLYIGIDGACSNHGKYSGYGIYFRSFPLKISGLANKSYKAQNDRINIEPVKKLTNNRAELSACLMCFYLLYHLKYPGKVIIVIDSMYVLNTVTKYFPDRLKRHTAHELKNLDLLHCIHHFRLKCNKVQFKHQYSHQKANMSPSWIVNNEADKLATTYNQLSYPEYKEIKIMAPDHIIQWVKSIY